MRSLRTTVADHLSSKFPNPSTVLEDCSDPLSGARPLSFETWYCFAAIVEVSDLNRYVTASQDDVEQSEVKGKLRELLIQLFNQARDKYTNLLKFARKNKEQQEGNRDYVSVARALADAYVVMLMNTPAINWVATLLPRGGPSNK